MGAEATLANGDCLIAVDRTLAEWALPASKTKGLTVDDMVIRLRKLFPGKYDHNFAWTYIADSVKLLSSYGVRSEDFARVSMAQLQAWVAKAPVLVTVEYKLLPYENRYDKLYDNAHAITLWGIMEGRAFYSDSYGRHEKYGNLSMPLSTFQQAWNSTRFYAAPRQGLRLI